MIQVICETSTKKKNLGSFSNLPASLIFSPTDTNLTQSNIDFSNVGNSLTKDSNAFKKIQKFSKVSSSNITRDTNSNLSTLKKIDNLYISKNSLVSNAYNYGNSNQNAFASVNSVLPMNTTLLDTKGLNKYLDYSLALNTDKLQKNSNLQSLNFFDKKDLNENLLTSIHSDFFSTRKSSLVKNTDYLNTLFSGKDKLSNLNSTNKLSLANKLSSAKTNSDYKDMLDELVSDNNNAYYT